MTGAELLADLDRLAAELGALVDVVERSDDAAAIRAAWRRTGAAFERWRARAPELERLAPDDRARVARRLGDLVRLNALATAVSARETDRTGARLRGTAAARRRLRDAVRAARTGGACDLAG